MAKYRVSVESVDGHAVPPLLEQFGEWLAKQEYKSLGSFSLRTVSLSDAWSPEVNARLAQDGFGFARTPDGSQLALLGAQGSVPPAVVILGSEGETETVADSLEEFLALLAAGDTGVLDLDEEEAAGRKKLQSWLKKNQVQAPKAPALDFAAYLGGASLAEARQAAAPQAAATQAPIGVSKEVAAMPPFLKRLATLIGRRADDPEMEALVVGTLGKKLPGTTSRDGKHVGNKKLGVELYFDHDIVHELYPPIAKTKNSYIPYLKVAWLYEKFPDPLPFGLKCGMNDAQLRELLGPPDRDLAGGGMWERVLDAGRAVGLTVNRGQISLDIAEHRRLEEVFAGELHRELDLFVAWLIDRGLLEESRFPEHARLIGEIRARKRTGGDFVRAALPYGLWSVHVKDRPGFRELAYAWFHNLSHEGVKSYIQTDLIDVFGGREGKYGHEEPVLEDDGWANVDRAAAKFAARFGKLI